MTAVANVDAAPVLAYTTLRGSLSPEHVPTMCSFARPADATAYGVNDCICDNSGSARALVFPVCGRGGIIYSASMVVAQTVAASFDLLLYDQEPTNIADNAPLADVAADQTKLLGIYRFLDGSKINIGTNLEWYPATSATTDRAIPPIAYTTLDNRLWAKLVTRSAYTPASACKFVIRLNLTRVVG